MLPSLIIKNFRCLENLTFNHLARVNLLVGRNNVGKSSVLEALRIYAGNANIDLLREIADSHDEKSFLDEDNTPKPYEDLFTGRKFSEGDKTELKLNGFNEHVRQQLESTAPEQIKKSIIIGHFSGKEVYSNSICYGNAIQKNHDNSKKISDQAIANFENLKTFAYYSFLFICDEDILNKEIPCSFIPTQFVEVEKLEGDWSNINLTDNEEIVTQALQIIRPDFRRLAFDWNKNKRWIKVKLANESKPVPLKSLGDGMLRILQIAIKLVSAQGGFLLIDEFENGLHYSVQEKVWDLLFKMAEQLDVQIFATTHSWDCVKSFRTVWEKEENLDKGSFHRLFLHPIKNKIDVMRYDCETLDDSIEENIEVR